MLLIQLPPGENWYAEELIMMKREKIDNSAYLQIDGIFVTTTNCGVTHFIEKTLSLGPRTKVRVVRVTPAHPDYPRRGYGPGVMVTPVNPTHKSYAIEFYLSDAELTKGALKTT